MLRDDILEAAQLSAAQSLLSIAERLSTHFQIVPDPGQSVSLVADSQTTLALFSDLNFVKGCIFIEKNDPKSALSHVKLFNKFALQLAKVKAADYRLANILEPAWNCNGNERAVRRSDAMLL